MGGGRGGVGGVHFHTPHLLVMGWERMEVGACRRREGPQGARDWEVAHSLLPLRIRACAGEWKPPQRQAVPLAARPHPLPWLSARVTHNKGQSGNGKPRAPPFCPLPCGPLPAPTLTCNPPSHSHAALEGGMHPTLPGPHVKYKAKGVQAGWGGSGQGHARVRWRGVRVRGEGGHARARGRDMYAQWGGGRAREREEPAYERGKLPGCQQAQAEAGGSDGTPHVCAKVKRVSSGAVPLRKKERKKSITYVIFISQ